MVGSLLLWTAEGRAQVSHETAFAAGVIAFADGDYEAATALFRQVWDAEPTHRAAGHYLGRCFLAQEAYEQAVDQLSAVAQTWPEALEVQLDLGVAYLLWGNVAFAVRTLDVVVRRRPRSVRARYLLGLALTRQGDCDAAVRHLVSAERGGQAWAVRAAYVAGLCRLRQGEFLLARQTLEPLAKLSRRDPYGRAARRFLRLALRGEGIEAKLFEARAAFSVQFDSNPTVGPPLGELSVIRGDSPTVPAELALAPDAAFPSLGLVFEGDLVVRPIVAARRSLVFQLGFLRSFYLPGERTMAATGEGVADLDVRVNVDDYNYTNLRASAFFQRRWRGARTRQQLQLGYDFNLGLFDGGFPLTDDHHLYMELHGGRGVWSIRESETLETRVSVLLQHRTFALQRFNNLGATLGVGQAFAFPSVGVQLYVEGTVRTEDAQSREYDIIAPGGLVSLNWRAPWSLMASAWVLFEHEIHHHSVQDRRDERVTAAVSVQRELIDHLALMLSWMHVDVISNVAGMTYDRDVLSLALRGAW
jgi:tetratricopeptide (TPR) repeat protein